MHFLEQPTDVVFYGNKVMLAGYRYETEPMPHEYAHTGIIKKWTPGRYKFE